MKYAIIADIHANLPALKVVFGEAAPVNRSHFRLEAGHHSVLPPIKARKNNRLLSLKFLPETAQNDTVCSWALVR